MQTRIESATVRELQKQVENATNRLEFENARAELRETVKALAKRDFRQKLARLKGNFG